MSNIHFLSWAEQQTLFKLSCADAETCSQLSSVVCFGFIVKISKLALASNIKCPRTTHSPLSKEPRLSSERRKWLSHALLKEQNRHLPRLVDSTVDMFVEHASLVGRERPNALVTSLAAATAERLASSAATRTEKERSRNGKIYLYILMTSTVNTIFLLLQTASESIVKGAGIRRCHQKAEQPLWSV